MLQQWFSGGQILSQKGKYAVNLGQEHEIYIGIASTHLPKVHHRNLQESFAEAVFDAVITI